MYPTDNQRQQEPERPAIDAFLAKSSKRYTASILSACGFGGLMIGLVIHSFPAFRMLAAIMALIICAVLAGVVAFPAIQTNLEYQRSHGRQRLQSTRYKRAAALDGAVLFQAGTPVVVFLCLVLLGVLIGAM